MPFLRPLPMAKVGVLGLKDDREAILSALHDLGAIQVEPVSKPTLEHLAPERASDLAREVGDELLRIRAMRAALPPMPGAAPRAFPDLSAVLAAARSVTLDTEVGTLTREADHLTTQAKALDEERDVLTRFGFYTDRLEFLQAKHLFAFFGESTPEAYAELTSAIPGLSDADFLAQPAGDRVRFLIAVRREQAEQVSRLTQQKGVTLIAVPHRAGPADEELPRIEAERAAVEGRLTEIRARLAALSAEWYPLLAALEEALAIENRKLEVHTRLAVSATAFALEGWVPLRDLPRLREAVERAAQGRAYLYDVPTTEEPPTQMANPAGVSRYEFFIRFYSLPLASEWDPTWTFAIAFPIFFGLMLGDIGYALVILLVSLWMIAGFPGGRRVPGFIKSVPKLIMPPSAMRSLAYTLVPGSIIGIVFGIVFNAFFGFHILPFTILDPIEPAGLGRLLVIAGYIGLGMLVYGFALGGLKEYFHHHYRGALGKLGGILFALGVAFVGLAMLRGHTLAAIGPAQFGANVLLLPAYLGIVGGLALLLVGEGGQGLMAVMEIVSHVLSYTRVVGILLASIILASLVDMGATYFVGQGPAGVIGAIAVLIFGQGFNLVLAVFEPGIQGARLIFVEHFSKFYSGNGRAFRPFGTDRRHTVAPGPSPNPSAGMGTRATVGGRRR